MIKDPIYQGILQSDLDFAGFEPINLDGWPPSGGGGGGTSDPNTVVATDIGMVGDGATDNTAALQAWLNSVGTAKVNSTLLVPDGVYVFSGPLQGVDNSQIIFPREGNSTTSRYSITIRGYHPLSIIPWFNPFIAPLPKGPIFKSTLAVGSGTEPSFICGGKGPDASTGYVNFLCVRFADIVFQTVPNPQISCINLRWVSYIQFLGDVLVTSTNSVNYSDAVQPTTATSYGVITPPTGCTMLHQINNLQIFNFYNGMLVGELANINNLYCYYCINGIEIYVSLDVILINRYWNVSCIHGINITGNCTFKITQMDSELGPQPPAGWPSQDYAVDDIGNLGHGEITWSSIDITSAASVFNMHGGANINAQPCGGPRYIGTDARLVPITGGVKLEVRNAGTGVWVEATRYTNP